MAVRDHSYDVRGRSQLVNVIADAVSGSNPLSRDNGWISCLDHVAETVLHLARNSWTKSSVATRVWHMNSANILRSTRHSLAIYIGLRSDNTRRGVDNLCFSFDLLSHFSLCPARAFSVLAVYYRWYAFCCVHRTTKRHGFVKYWCSMHRRRI